MFTGIVRELGTVESATGTAGALRLEIAAPTTAALTTPGDSVAVNGCCLTAVAVAGGVLAFDAVAETLARTTLAGLTAGARVNLEPALRAGEPLGGHFVQGHVDGVGVVGGVEDGEGGRRVRVALPARLRRHIVEKGSVTLDGVSLTVAALEPDGLTVALVPHTLAATTFGELGVGAEVNVEVDVLAKYVEALTRTPADSL